MSFYAQTGPRARTLGRRLLLALLGVGILLGAWALASISAEAVRIPSPLQVWQRVNASWFEIPALEFIGFGSGGLITNLGYTISSTLWGVAFGTILAIPVGILVGRVPSVRAVFETPLVFLVTLPVLVLLPFLSLWFGVSRLATSGMVIFYTFATVSVGVRQATLSTASHFENYAMSLGAGRWHILRVVIAPALIPELVGLIRGALAFGWGLEAVAEILGGQVGIGRILRVFTQSAATADMIGAILVLGVAALVIDALVAAGGRWLGRWQE